MKINILLDNPSDVRAGYVNVDPFVKEGADRVRCDPSKLEAIADRGEVEDLVAIDVLDYYPIRQAGGLLDHWVGLLAHGGTITLGVVETMEVARALRSRAISPAEANTLLHGEQTRAWQHRQSSYTGQQIVDSLEARGLRVIRKKMNGFAVFITAERP